MATYSYLANSSLVGQIGFKSNTVTRMTTSKQYDYFHPVRYGPPAHDGAGNFQGLCFRESRGCLPLSHGVNRLSSISSTPSNAFTYQYNAANQRTMNQLADGSYWRYGYDAFGQVIGGNKYWVDETPVAGQQFDYTFDTIGNRTQTEAGGDQNGANLRVANYTNNSVNELTSRGVPGDVDVMGVGIATNAVTVNGTTAYRKNEYFREQLPVTNTSAAVWNSITISNTGTTASGHLYVAKTPEDYTYDADGNLLSDGRWDYTWDGENRLTSMTSLSGAPSGSQLELQFAYDYMGRRIQKIVSTNSTGTNYVGQYTNTFAYDGWNALAVMNPSFAVSNTFLWGSDLSGSPQGAGGVGGLIKVSYNGTTTTNCFVTYDGNGNVSALVNAANGVTVANYAYGPFGEVLRMTGPMAKLNPFTFQTEFYDWETDKIYWKHRYYDPSPSKWLSRDPLTEPGFYLLTTGRQAFQNSDEDSPDPNSFPTAGGPNVYAFTGNDPVNDIDAFGLIVIFVHGTWSSGPEAFSPAFVQHVVNYFGDTHSLLFEWSGGNTEADRAEGGRRLAALLNASWTQNPCDPIRVVGHSHGGNVALIASHITEANIDVLVTLGTPILARYTRGPAILYWYNVYSTDDWVQTKPWGAQRTSAQANKNIRLTGYGHSELHTIPAWDAAFPPGANH